MTKREKELIQELKIKELELQIELLKGKVASLEMSRNTQIPNQRERSTLLPQSTPSMCWPTNHIPGRSSIMGEPPFSYTSTCSIPWRNNNCTIC